MGAIMFTDDVKAEISELATARKFEPAAILAIAEVESAGRPFWTVDGKQVPAMRFEGHYFFRLLTREKRQRALSLGLATRRAGGVANPRGWSARYALLDRAKAIDVDAALMSCSWGLGQVMGSHWEHLGFSSVHEMVDRAFEGVTGQVDLMLRFIDRNGLRDEIERRYWAGFARAYNGPAYRKNLYDKKMAAAYVRYAGEGASSLPIRMPVLRRGSYGDSVWRLQSLLKTYTDGRFGPATERAVKAFQRDHGLKQDGVVGSMTWAELG